MGGGAPRLRARPGRRRRSRLPGAWPDHRRARAAARAVPRPPRGVPPRRRGRDLSLRHVRRPARLLPLLGQPRGSPRARALRPSRRRAPEPRGRHLHGAPADEFLAGRGGRPRPRPRLPAGGGPRALSREPRGPRRAPRERGLPRVARVPGRPHARAVPARPPARRHGGAPAPARGPHLRPRRPCHPRPHRGRRIRRLHAPADARARRTRAARRAGALAMSTVAVTTTPLAAAYDYCAARTRRAASNFYWGFRLLTPDR